MTYFWFISLDALLYKLINVNLDSLVRGIGLQQKYIVLVVESSMYKRRPILLYKLDFFQFFGHSKSSDEEVKSDVKIDGWPMV